MKIRRLLTPVVVLGWFAADVALLIAYLPRLLEAARLCVTGQGACAAAAGYAVLLVLAQVGMVGALFVRNGGDLEAILERD